MNNHKDKYIHATVTSMKWTALMGIFLCLATLAHAQESEDDLRWEERESRAEGFHEKMLSTREGVVLFQNAAEEKERELRQYAEDCHGVLYRSKTRTRIGNLLRCYRGKLQITTDVLERQWRYLSEVPGVSEEARTNALEAIDELIEAIDAIILGIDADVYDNEDEVKDSKKSLVERYYQPYWLALTHLRADRLQTWAAHLLLESLLVVENADLSEGTFSKLKRATRCLEQGELFLGTVMTYSNPTEASAELFQTLGHLQSCTEMLREAYTSSLES